MNLRVTAEKDLGLTLESPDDWGLPVTLRSPDGEMQSYTVVLSADDISFASSDNSVNSTSSDFRDYLIAEDDVLEFSGSIVNTGTYTVTSITENKILVTESVVTESAGSTIKVINQNMPLNGQVMYDTIEQNTDNGMEELVHKPVVTVRRASLSRVPLQTEKNQWLVSIPLTPSPTATLQPYIMDRPSESGESIGFIRLYLSKPVQSS